MQFESYTPPKNDRTRRLGFRGRLTLNRENEHHVVRFYVDGDMPRIVYSLNSVVTPLEALPSDIADAFLKYAKAESWV